MAQKLTASIPADLSLPANWIVRLTAVDPTTGALVAGVTVSNVAIVAQPVTPHTVDTVPVFEPVDATWLSVPLDSTEPVP